MERGPFHNLPARTMVAERTAGLRIAPERRTGVQMAESEAIMLLEGTCEGVHAGRSAEAIGGMGKTYAGGE